MLASMLHDGVDSTSIDDGTSGPCHRGSLLLLLCGNCYCYRTLGAPEWIRLSFLHYDELCSTESATC